MKRDFVAGLLLANTVPHVLVGVAGKRCLTPLGGEESSAGLNLVWAGMNLTGAAVALSTGRWRAAGQAEVDERLATVQYGMFAMALFSFGYQLTAGRRKRRAGGPTDARTGP